MPNHSEQPQSPPLKYYVHDKRSVNKKTPTQLKLPRAALFESALRSGAHLSSVGLLRLTVDQIRADATAKNKPFDDTPFLHEKADLTLATACFYIRASHRLPPRHTTHPAMSRTTGDAMRLCAAKVRAFRVRSMLPYHAMDALEEEDQMAVAIIYKLAASHDFCKTPTPDLAKITTTHLRFGSGLTLEHRAAREDGFVRSALGLGRGAQVSGKSMRGMSSLNSPVAADSDDEGNGPIVADLLSNPDDEFVLDIEQSSAVLQHTARFLNFPHAATLRAMLPRKGKDLSAAEYLRAALALHAALGTPAERKELNLPTPSAPALRALRTATAAAGQIVTAFDDGDDLGAIPHLTTLGRLVHMSLGKMDLLDTAGNTELDDPHGLIAALRAVYAEIPDPVQCARSMIGLTILWLIF